MKKTSPNRFPKGWNAAKVRAVLDHYENQSEEEAVAEDEAAFGRGLTTVMEVPTVLVPEFLALIAEHQQNLQRNKRRKKSA